MGVMDSLSCPKLLTTISSGVAVEKKVLRAALSLYLEFSHRAQWVVIVSRAHLSA